MNGSEMLRLLDAISRDRNVEKEVLIVDLEQAMVSAARKHYNAVDTEDFTCEIDRFTGQIVLWREEDEIDLADLGRIPAQTAKQVMIQRFREDERDAIYNEYIDMVGTLATGVAQRYEGGSLVVSIGRAEGFMPRSEQIPGEQHQPGERVRCLILDVRDAGNQVKIVLSRASPDFIRRMFEIEVPEVAERIIEVKAMAREAGHRTKIAVQSIDSKVDAVGACVGVRGSRIKNIVDELAGERIDIVRWNDSLQILVPNALQPAEAEDVILCPMLGKVIVLVRDDQLSLAIGRRGQNVRLASKLCGWDINVMTQESLDEQLDISIEAFSVVPKMPAELCENLVSQGFFTFDDLSVIEPDELLELSGLSQEDVDEIIEFADVESLRIEKEEIAAAAARKLNPPPPPEAKAAEAKPEEAAAATPEQPAEESAGDEPGGVEATSEGAVTTEPSSETPAEAEEAAADVETESEASAKPAAEEATTTSAETEPVETEPSATEVAVEEAATEESETADADSVSPEQKTE